MQLDVITLSIYRLKRSKEDLEAAISNHESGCNPEMLDSELRETQTTNYFSVL